MINITWDNRYEVGFEKIDNEHRVFIDLIRSSSYAIDINGDINYASRLLEELVLYAKFHFFSEETLMINSGYPHYESHKQAHIQLLATLEQQIHEYKKNPENREIGESLIEYIFEWLVLHILKVDKMLANYLAEQKLPDYL